MIGPPRRSGYFHHFHQQWAGAICDSLNAGRLPKGVFAFVERYACAKVPDVLALETSSAPQDRDWAAGRGEVTLATEPPKTRFVSHTDQEAVYAAKANQVVLHRGR